jgi:acetyltransferase-like isoleucine patch superfamily enzyme
VYDRIHSVEINVMSQNTPPSETNFSLKNALPQSWHRLTEALFIGMVGWLPSKLGTMVRRALYPKLFRRMGEGCNIAKGVGFYGLQQIEIGDNASLSSSCRLISSEQGGKIILDSGVALGEGVRIQSIGSQGKVWLKDQVMFDRGVDINSCEHGQVEVGRETFVGPYACMAGPGRIVIGEYCMIASHCGIYANTHIFTDRHQPIMLQGITTEGIVIEDDCWLGTGVKVLDGVTIGRGCVIGAGAVVTKDIPAYSIAVGVPAKVIGIRGQVKPSQILQNEPSNNFQQAFL